MPNGYYDGITVQEWLEIIPGLNGKCSKLCYGCKLPWGQIMTGGVHIHENIEHGRKSCDMIHVFLCDKCETNLSS